MKIQAKINLLCATESGMSKATGNPWQSKTIVVEFEDEHGIKSTMALKTFNSKVIESLEKCVEGDEVKLDVYFSADYREFKRLDGTTGEVRQTNCFITDVEVTKEEGF